ncbi:MAG: rRNA pseudouridine synthase [Caldilineaceae bacterium]|nr:rRNA pseudouridine synthase [Caldilineaceae bacterium]
MVDGKALQFAQQAVYYKMYKPRGLLSDIGGDARGRPTVADLLPDDARRVFPVGRLDLNSEGLVLLTDDGDLAHKLTHPRYQHPKTYYVLVAERPGERALEQLRTGVEWPEGRSAPAQVKVVNKPPAELTLDKGGSDGVWLEIVLREGKKRQIRHMTSAVGFSTLRLIRWSIGPLTLAKLAPSSCTHLSKGEVAALQKMVAGVKEKSSEPSSPGQRQRRSPRGKNSHRSQKSKKTP